MTDGFARSLAIGDRGVALVRPLLEREFSGRAIVVGFDGYDGFARKGGDLIIPSSDGSAVRIECKTEEVETGNHAPEEWSDYARRTGWLESLVCDYICHVYLNTTNAYLYRWPDYKGLLCANPASGERRMPRIEQRNKTLVRLMSVAWFNRSIWCVEFNVAKGARLVHDPAAAVGQRSGAPRLFQ